jgi:transposase
LLESQQSINGFGFMDLSIQNQEKIKAWILPCTNTQVFNRVLADFAREFQLNQNKRVLLVLDQAGWRHEVSPLGHISHQLTLPEGLDLFFLPAYSPELQPAERLWPLTNEVIANHSPRSLCELEELLIVRCRKLLKQHDLIKGLTCYHWWPMTRAS